MTLDQVHVVQTRERPKKPRRRGLRPIGQQCLKMDNSDQNVRGFRMLGVATVAAGEPDANKGRRKPEDGRQEGEGLSGSPAVAGAAVGDPTPVKGAGATGAAGEVDEQTEGGEPAERHEDVDGPGDEAAAEGDQPDETQQHGQAGDDEGVDEASMRPDVVVSVCDVQDRGSGLHVVGRGIVADVVSDDAGHHRSKGDFANAQRDGDHARKDRHDGGWYRVWVCNG